MGDRQRVATARARAEGAAAAAGVRVTDVDNLGECRDVERVLAEIWGRRGNPPVAAELLRALQHSGGYVAIARRNDEVVGASVAWIGLDGSHLHLHSHITGVLESEQGRAVGFAIKQHQRWWALERDVFTVRWTFDPLVRRNTRFNVAKLGARVAAFHTDFYGSMLDEINAGDVTDRAEAVWDLARDQPSGGDDPDLAALRRDGASVILEEADGRPVVVDPPSDRAVIRLARVPADIVAVRVADPNLAKEWRMALRESVGAAITSGAEITAVTRDGWYVLEEGTRE